MSFEDLTPGRAAAMRWRAVGLTCALALGVAACSDRSADPAVPPLPSTPATPAPAVAPALPAQPAQPALPAQPADPAQPAQPAQPALPAQPADPAQPAQPALPSQPAPSGIGPNPPGTGLSTPIEPVRPVQPVAPMGAAGAPAAGQTRGVNAEVQGAAPAGLTVRVKRIEMGADATVLDVSASFANPLTGSTKLAFGQTYLETPEGQRLMLKRPEDNRDLRILANDTMEGRLVFLGSVPANAAQLRFVINEGASGADLIGPGLVMQLPVK